MRPLTPLEQETAESLAFSLADVYRMSVPSLWGESHETVVAMTLPAAVELVRYAAKAARNSKHAKKYRKLMREARALVRTEPDGAVPAAVIAGTMPFDPKAWHAELRPGPGHELLEVP